MQERTKKIIKEDIETIRAYADCFGVEMPDLDENGEVVGLPAPYPREVAGVVRSGYRIYELGQKALETGIPCLNPILGRNTAEETWKESCDIYKYADMYNDTIFQFVHSEATRHIDPLKGRELIEQSRGKGGITPKGEREFIQMGGGAKHPVRINATGDTAHINILNALIAGFAGTDPTATPHPPPRARRARCPAGDPRAEDHHAGGLGRGAVEIALFAAGTASRPGRGGFFVRGIKTPGRPWQTFFAFFGPMC